VFDVGSSALIPYGPGGIAWLQYGFLDQTQNWSGSSRAPAADNGDKNIRTNFYTVGAQYMFNESWGVMAEVPYTDRHFVTVDSGAPETFNHVSLGDIRLMGVYSGFQPDMSAGIVAGAKLPTGDSTYAHFDPDVEIGSGSTDLILGAYKTGALTSDQSFHWFGQAMWQHEIATQHHYTPGSEFNAAAGISFEGWDLAPNVNVAPLAQVIYSHRGQDSGIGDPENTGYDRALVSPGISLAVDRWKLYADAEFAVYQNVNGNQLTAPVAFKAIVSYGF
jgi:hypothetical protein